MRLAFGFLAVCLAAPAFAQSANEPEVWAHLPEPVTNNAVAGVELDGRLMAYSFAGLHEGKTWRDVTADAYACDLDARTCREIDGLPDGVGRLASIAVTVRDQIYIFGGYTVAEDGSERSTPEVWRFDPASETYTHITDMPVPVDDTVALPYRDRYIYLVSGWHDTDNVDLVQVYDVEADRWFEATPFPGAPVFGHAGALNDGPTAFPARILICGGTAVIPPREGETRRRFEAVPNCWLGGIGHDPASIAWSATTPLPDGPIYRGIATVYGSDFFALLGGSDNAYNYDGIGYNSVPSMPRRHGRGSLITSFRPCGNRSEHEPVPWRTPDWQPVQNSLQVMDIRGTVSSQLGDRFFLGGMTADLGVSDVVWALQRQPYDDTIIVTACDHWPRHKTFISPPRARSLYGPRVASIRSAPK